MHASAPQYSTQRAFPRYQLAGQGDWMTKLESLLSAEAKQRLAAMKGPEVKKGKKGQVQMEEASPAPADAMSLKNAVLYLKNVLLAVQNAKHHQLNQAIFTKFCLRQVIWNHYANEEKIRGIIVK
mmetsp:Transcript_17761/g.12695  ORF Transcript_17761/g.12695 Transcript_17761/m.12695 type:complete len:125 (+) Transcript_17761:1-375(+)